jgi:type II secretory pathway component PulJ
LLLGLLTALLLVVVVAALLLGARSSRRRPRGGQPLAEKSFAEPTSFDLGQWQPDRPINLLLEVDHLQLDGTTLRGQIRVKRYRLSKQGDQAILGAHCQLLKRFLDFNSQSLQRCLDLQSGERIDDLPAFLEASHAASQQGQLDRLYQSHQDELALLLYVGRADGVLQRREKELIAHYLAGRFTGGFLQVEEIARDLAWKPVPNKNDFRLATQRLVQLEAELKNQIVQLCRQLIEVKETLDGDEEASMAEVIALLQP